MLNLFNRAPQQPTKPSHIDVATIGQAYSGRIGCACGCMGMHYYRESLINRGNEIRGYSLLPYECKDSQIERIVKLMNDHIQAGYDFEYDPDGIFSLESRNRLYICYTMDYLMRDIKAA